MEHLVAGVGGETGTCLPFKVHQEAPGDQDQVQLPASPPAPCSSSTLPCPRPCPHPRPLGGLWSVPVTHTPLSPQTSPGSRPQMAPSPPASRSPRAHRTPVPREEKRCQRGNSAGQAPPPVKSVLLISRKNLVFLFQRILSLDSSQGGGGGGRKAQLSLSCWSE